MAVYAIPALAFAATPKTFCELSKLIVSVVNSLTALLVLAAVVIYLYDVSSFVGKAGEERGKMKTIIMWGIVALFVMVSIWGILHILQTTLFPVDSGTGASC